MIMPSDKEYKETKLIMQGKSEMKSEFRELADWIDKTYDVKTINIFCDTIENGNRPRVQIIFEYHKEANKFYNKEKFCYDEAKQQEIAKQYSINIQNSSSLKTRPSWKFWEHNYNLNHSNKYPFVIFSAFEPIARQEANGNISQKEINQLKNEINDKNLWEISNGFVIPNFFLYTDKQVEEYNKNGIKGRWSSKFFDILEKYDEFSYFNRDNYSINIDSKENFDNNYQSNWYYYYK